MRSVTHGPSRQFAACAGVNVVQFQVPAFSLVLPFDVVQFDHSLYQPVQVASRFVTFFISVSAGPIGRHAEADTDLEMKAEIYSYSKSKGLFAGVSLKGASIQIDKDANNAFYGPGDVKASDILDGKKTADIPLLDKLKRALLDYTSTKI